MLNEANHCTQHFKNSRGSVLSKCLRVNDLHMIAEVCTFLALFDVYVYFTGVQFEIVFLMNPAGSHTLFWFFG